MIPNKKILTAILWWLSLVLLSQAPLIELPEPDLDALKRADLSRENPRFAAPVPLDVWPSADGWESNNGVNGVWRTTFSLTGADGLALYLDRFDLPARAEIWLENTQGRRGPFLRKDISAEDRLFTGFLPGESVDLVYRGTIFSAGEPPFHVWRADHVYRSDVYGPRSTASLNFGASNDCEVNANCSEGDGWDNEKSATARVIAVAEEGSFYCSGCLINNTAEDGRPLFLTAYHCQENLNALYDLWRFDFGYLAPGCSDPVNEPNFTSYDGSLFRAGREENDFLLLEIVDPDFDQTTHFFGGWDRRDGNVSGATLGLHHPAGDVQKVTTGAVATGLSVFNNVIVWENIVTPADHHFRMSAATGTYEVGSSGSAIYDNAHRIRGQLHGGNTNCPGSSILYFGRIFQSWTGGEAPDSRLSDWLDPLGTEAEFFDGTTLQGNGVGRIVRGNIHWLETPIAGARLIFDWGDNQIDTVFSDTAGNYQLPRPADATSVNIATSYEDGDELTGVNVTDIIALRRHILGFITLSDRQLVASDVNNSGNETIGDIVKMSQVILAISNWTARPNWLVFPSLLSLEGLPTNVFGPFDIGINNPAAGIIRLDFEVVKNGDANDNAY